MTKYQIVVSKAQAITAPYDASIPQRIVTLIESREYADVDALEVDLQEESNLWLSEFHPHLVGHVWYRVVSAVPIGGAVK